MGFHITWLRASTWQSFGNEEVGYTILPFIIEIQMKLQEFRDAHGFPPTLAMVLPSFFLLDLCPREKV